MVTIVGLGNPGAEYADTRHNVGWLALSAFVDTHALPSFVQSARYAGMISEGVVEGIEVGLLLPTVFMNNSGTSVTKYLKEQKDNGELVVIHDDVDIPFGEVRIAYDRGAGGHNGVQSIINARTTKEFIRVRIGVTHKNFFGVVRRPRGEALSSFVLESFSKSEQSTLPAVYAKVDTALMLILTKGVQTAMQEVNI